MYSNITEAWGHDPIKEITDKLSRGDFDADLDQNKIFKFKNKSNEINEKKIVKFKDRNNSSLSDVNSISILSDGNTSNTNDLINSFTSKSKNIPLSSNKYSNHYPINIDSDDSYSHNISRCDYSIKHLKKCDNCYSNIKCLIKAKVNKKFDEFILENKLKQLQNNIPQSNLNQMQPINTCMHNSSNWKETLIIVIGVIITMLIIFLIIKSSHN